MIRAAAFAAALAASFAWTAAAEDALPSSGRTWDPVELVHPEVGRKLRTPAPRAPAPRPEQPKPSEPSAPPEPVAPVASAEAPQDATVAFAPGSAEIGAGLAAQLEPIAAQLAGSRSQVRIDAYGGTGAADPQRLALRRGLALRSFLIARGVPAANIEMRARLAGGDGDPDRAELRVGR